ncbi:MAG: ABC transporter permease [Armatimonadota bacterium]|nr:ABC transporter permease [Armatimonadota bacterium]MDR7469786.1 ABC transporter permease [Armatimonadota bacterium]MDR7474685.1 ABC transporter permease [Armatimonadota bacterium]MDR7539448.1 ABC transporter permease [Armatimonadota bacterium]
MVGANSPAPARRRRAAHALVLLSLLAAWEGGVRAGLLDPFYTSAPLPVLTTVLRWIASGYVFEHVFATLAVTLAGLAGGVLLGVAAGFALAFLRGLEAIASPFLAAGNAMPRIILYPLMVLWLGFGPLSRIVLVASLVVFPALLTTHSAIRQVDAEIVRNARVLGARGLGLIRHIYMPAVALWIFRTIRVTMGFALAGAIVGEYVGAVRGMGMVIAFAQSMFRARDVMAGTAVLLAVIWLIDLGLRAAENAAARWRLSEVV